MRSKKAGTPPELDLVSKALKMPPGWEEPLTLSQQIAKTLQPPSLEDIAIYEYLFNLEQAEKLSEMLRAKGESLNSIQEALTKKSVDAMTLAMLIGLERNRPVSHIEEYVNEKIKEEKQKRFVIVREQGTQAKTKNAQQLDKNIATINADLLAKPASEGWGSTKKRVDHIARATGYAPSYISKKIAKPRKTNQT